MNTYNKYYKRNNKNFKLSKYITKILVSIIFLLISIIYIKSSKDNSNNYEKLFLNESISFTKVNDWYQKYFGNIVPIPDVSEAKTVFNETLTYSNMDNYLNGKILSVNEEYTVPALQSGIIVFMGEKEGYGNTIIIQGIDGVDIWYGNINTSNLNLYDYVKKGSLLSNTNDSTLYLVFMKDNNYISYEEYIQS